ncbi:MAG: hypothetical protein MTP17_00140 [Candidatus Midichloria sp.]|nr:MAG: hypothetical protein MTP17_00140 [Candidatus Midichloria sp.]
MGIQQASYNEDRSIYNAPVGQAVKFKIIFSNIISKKLNNDIAAKYIICCRTKDIICLPQLLKTVLVAENSMKGKMIGVIIINKESTIIEVKYTTNTFKMLIR